ncbi:hypothetical protein V8N76_004509 [Salmonella enterica]
MIAGDSRNNAERQLRLKLIDAMLSEHGRLQREHLCQAFGISMPCASRDIRHYREINGTGVQYNASERYWGVTDDFKPMDGLLAMPAREFITTLEHLFNVKLV